MISIRNIKVDYGNQNVLNNLDLEIKPNTIHGLVGLNGSGKTTLLNTIFGIKKMTQGDILYNGHAMKRQDIAYLETINYFYPRITGREYLAIFSIKNKNFEIDKWNNLFELPLDKLVDDYSTGMKKKLAFIGIVTLNREILILDEPFNGIDMETVQKIKLLLKQLKSDMTILVTSHILESLTGICDQISYLNNGKIQFTKDSSDFGSIENEIFAVHQDKIDSQIRDLIGKM
ncbi:MAG: ATP-binding cassette domain-containing protein [Bacteroidales bacterium]|nr:ATP-binding cassette domain-containing protein [Bacteroidales bacterium]